MTAKPVSPDLTVSNSDGVLYVKGNETTDGSIRLRLDEGATICNMESRANGVWNDTGLRISSSTLSIGRDMNLSAIAGYLQTENPSASAGHIRSLIPHIVFPETGTAGAHAPIVNALETFTVFSMAVSEIVGTVIGIQLGVLSSRVLDQSIHEVGTVGATAEVTVSLYTGTDNTGFEFNRKVLPPSDLVSNMTLTIDYGEDLGFEPGIQTFMEFTSLASFSLKTDAGGNPLTSHVGHAISELDLILDELTLSREAEITFDREANFVIGRRF